MVKESSVQKVNPDEGPKQKDVEEINEDNTVNNAEDKKLDKNDWKVNEEINLKLRDYVWVFFVFSCRKFSYLYHNGGPEARSYLNIVLK